MSHTIGTRNAYALCFVAAVACLGRPSAFFGELCVSVSRRCHGLLKAIGDGIRLHVLIIMVVAGVLS